MALHLVHHHDRHDAKFIMDSTDFRFGNPNFGYEDLGVVVRNGPKVKQPATGLTCLPYKHVETGKTYLKFSDWSAAEA